MFQIKNELKSRKTLITLSFVLKNKELPSLSEMGVLV